MTLIFDEYRERLQRRRRHPSTIKGFNVAVQRFSHWCEEHGVDPTEPDPIVLERFFDELDYKPSTKRGYLKHIRAAYRYGMSRGVISRDPTVDVELEREPDKTPRIIPIEVLRTSKRMARDDQQVLLFHICAYTGARQFEITKMRWEDIDLEARTIEVIGKAGKRRLIPIHPALGEILVGMTSRGFLFPGRHGEEANKTTMRYRLQHFAPEWGFHDFRRTVASSMDANGAEEVAINQIMGWAPKGVFNTYYRNVAPERLQQAILRLYASDPL